MCKQIIELTEEIMEVNKKRELEVLPIVNDEKDFVCCFDYGWQQRGSGNIYNSPSGHGLMTGARTKKVSKRLFFFKTLILNIIFFYRLVQRLFCQSYAVHVFGIRVEGLESLYQNMNALQIMLGVQNPWNQRHVLNC